MERVFTGRELVNTTSRLEWNAAFDPAELLALNRHDITEQ